MRVSVFAFCSASDRTVSLQSNRVKNASMGLDSSSAYTLLTHHQHELSVLFAVDLLYIIQSSENKCSPFLLSELYLLNIQSTNIG